MDSGVAAPRGVRGATVVLVGLVACVVASLGWLVSLPSAAERFDVPVAPMVVPITEGPQSVRTNVRLVVDVGPQGVALAPDWQGVATSVRVAVGDTVKTGTELLEVDASLRIAVATPRPFFRKLSAGDSGPDVDQLAAFLSARGDLASGWKSKHAYDAALGRAVRALAVDLNVSVLPGTGPMDFDPGWLVWIPGEPLLVDQVHITVGSVVPGVGQRVLSFRPTVTAVRLPVGAAGPSPGVVADEVIVGSLTLPIHGGTVTLDDAAREQVAKIIAPRAEGQGSDEAEQQAPAAGHEQSFDAVRHTTFDAAIRAVPVTAVVTDPSGLQCVVVPAPEGHYLGKQVTVVASETARSLAFVHGLSDATEAVANPAAANVFSACIHT